MLRCAKQIFFSPFLFPFFFSLFRSLILLLIYFLIKIFSVFNFTSVVRTQILPTLCPVSIFTKKKTSQAHYGLKMNNKCLMDCLNHYWNPFRILNETTVKTIKLVINNKKSCKKSAPTKLSFQNCVVFPLDRRHDVNI